MPGPPYQYQIALNTAVFQSKISSLKKRTQTLETSADSCIKEFTITRRPTLPQEMIKYLVMLEKSTFKEEAKFRRVCEAAMCSAVMKADLNYHVLLEDTSVIKYLYDIILRIGEKVFQVEKERRRGTILVAFPCSAKGLGILCVSSVFRVDEDSGSEVWDRNLHYNSNACAAEEYAALLNETPQDLGAGVVFDSVFSGANKRNVVLTFTEQAIATKKKSLHKAALDVIEEGNLHDESNLGENLNLGQINWVVRNETKLTVNHLYCEAAMCNASPLLPLCEENARLVLSVPVHAVLKELLASESAFVTKTLKKRF